MSFEQYQFLRYYLPGSLFLVYLGLLLAPFSSIHQASLIVSDLNMLATLLALVGGVFVVSPVVGYVLYSLYDTYIYNWLALNWEKRRSLSLLIKWALEKTDGTGIDNDGMTNEGMTKEEICDLTKVYNAVKDLTPKNLKAVKGKLEERIYLSQLRAPLKSLVDFVIHSGSRNTDTLEIKSEEVSANLRGYWSHFAARIVCGAIVPFLALLVAFLFILVPYYSLYKGGVFLPTTDLTPARWGWLTIDLKVMALVSIFILLFPWRVNNPRYEAFELEYFVISSRITTREEGANLYGATRRYFRERIRDARIPKKRRGKR